MNERHLSKSGNGIHQFEPTPVASLISKFMRVARRTLIHERDRLESKLHNNGPPGGLLPNERQRLAAVCGALASGRIARHRAARVICTVAALFAFGTGFGLDQAVAAQRVRADGEEGVQVLTRGQGSTRGFRSTPAVTATTHSTLITAGTIGRTVSGSTASKRTSDTAATTKRRDRRAHWWTRQNSARAA